MSFSGTAEVGLGLQPSSTVSFKIYPTRISYVCHVVIILHGKGDSQVRKRTIKKPVRRKITHIEQRITQFRIVFTLRINDVIKLTNLCWTVYQAPFGYLPYIFLTFASRYATRAVIRVFSMFHSYSFRVIGDEWAAFYSVTLVSTYAVTSSY